MNFTSLKILSPGMASGPIARLSAPLSLWGGLDLDDGTICDVNHPQCGQSLSGKVLAMRAARGSSSSSSALVEAARRGVAPRAIILVRPDPILAIGSLVAADLYAIQIPIVLFPEGMWENLPRAGAAIVEASETTGSVRFVS